MQVNPSPPVPQLLVTNTTATGDKALALSLGQIVNASVIKVANGQVTLQIDQTLLQARTALALLAGQKLELQVQQTDRQVVLQLTQQSIDQAVLAQGLRQNLPRQAPLDQALNPILRLLQPGAQNPAATLPASVQNIARQLFERLPDRQQIQTAQGLKQALENSGLLLESRLRQNLQTPGADANPPREDLKSSLLQLQHLLRLQVTRLEQRAPSRPEAQQIQSHLPEIRQQLQALLQDEVLPRLLERTLAQPKLNSQLTQFQQLARLVLESTHPSATGSGPERDRMLTLLQGLLNLANTLLLQTPLAQPAATNQGLVGHLLALRSALEKLLLPPPASPPAQAAEVTRGGGGGRESPPPLQQLGELLRHTEAATSRIQTQQLNALVEQEGGRLLWSLELPLRQGDKIELLRLRIERDGSGGGSEEQQAPLVVTLRLELEHAGPVAARLTLLGEQVSVVIWAEHDATLAAAREHLPKLEHGLARSGLKTQQVSLLQGQPPADARRPDEAHKPPLLDLKA